MMASMGRPVCVNFAVASQVFRKSWRYSSRFLLSCGDERVSAALRRKREGLNAPATTRALTSQDVEK
jgi:hypothetical protein